MSKLNNFSTILISIVLEGFPFILIGAFLSSLIQIFVSEDLLARIIPRNKIIGVICAAFMGLIFPVCECAIVPIVKKLMKKGMPSSMAITFMLSVPIVNPIVLSSTYYAFLGKSYMVLLRAFFGIVSAIIIGILMESFYGKEPLKDNSGEIECNCAYHSTNAMKKQSILSNILGHTSYEVYDVGRLFIFGATLSSAMQAFIPRNYILSIGKGNVSSIVVMMLLAFILSICSETDAFIARTFLGQFTLGSIIGFLILGPMIDIKNMVILCGNFKKEFVAKLIFLIFAICFMSAVIVNFIPI